MHAAADILVSAWVKEKIFYPSYGAERKNEYPITNTEY
jgi:hypothetical protein